MKTLRSTCLVVAVAAANVLSNAIVLAVPSEKTATESLAPVSVSGAANAQRVRYSDLLEGEAAFKKYRQYAPQADLSFFLETAKPGGTVPEQTTLALQTEEKDLNVPVAVDGKFVLPDEKQVGTKEADLVANRAEGTLAIVPTVRSPGDTPTRIRLGDLRLQCEVSWAIEKQGAPKAIRAFFFVGGRMCHSSKIAVNYFHGARRLSRVELSYGKREMDATIRPNGLTYWIPIGDTSWPDDSIVTLTYADSGGSP
jgi:hypothetical protein